MKILLRDSVFVLLIICFDLPELTAFLTVQNLGDLEQTAFSSGSFSF